MRIKSLTLNQIKDKCLLSVAHIFLKLFKAPMRSNYIYVCVHINQLPVLLNIENKENNLSVSRFAEQLAPYVIRNIGRFIKTAI